MIISFDRMRAQLWDKIENCLVYESKWYDHYEEAYNDGLEQLKRTEESCKNQNEDCFIMLQIDYEERKINGMPYSRYIAAQLLSNSNLKGDKYYEKENEYEAIISDAIITLNETYLNERKKENENWPFND